MKKIDLGQTMSILANIGVIVGIVFLVIELRQNNSLMEAESRAAAFSHRLVSINKLTESEIAQVLAKVAEGEELSIAEQLQLRGFHALVMESWEWTYEESQHGLAEISGTEIASVRRAFRTIPGLVEYWDSEQRSAPAEFRQWFDENIAAE